MSFQDEKLPAGLLTDMYRTVLIEQPEVNRALTPDLAEKTAAAAYTPRLGGNKQRIAVVAYGRKPLTETSQETQFLLKILQACSLTASDIVLYEHQDLKQGLDHFVKETGAEKLLFFGRTLNGIALEPESCFQQQQVEHATMLYAPAVDELVKDSSEAVVLKKKLWAALKNFFKV